MTTSVVSDGFVVVVVVVEAAQMYFQIFWNLALSNKNNNNPQPDSMSLNQPKNHVPVVCCIHCGFFLAWNLKLIVAYHRHLQNVFFLAK